MYFATNRRIVSGASGLDIFGPVPSEKGPNELRFVSASPSGGGYRTTLLDDQLTSAEVAAIDQQYRLGLDLNRPWYASLKVACDLMRQARLRRKHLLVYVHGYNNDLRDVMATAEALENLYDTIVVPFTWPANGGGTVTGTAAYLSDKQDARASIDALNRFIGRVRDYHALLTVGRRDQLWQKARSGYENNPQAVQERFAALLSKDCKVTLNLLCHSMGNYLLKHALDPTGVASRDLVFDNVCLVAADANNEGHPQWTERIQFRNRLYVVINENDFALAWSRRKPGEEQLARLGHYLKNLTARNARYVDVTPAAWVRNAHGYFTGEPVEKNKRLRAFFAEAFTGGKPEEALDYLADRNAYTLS